MSTIQFREKPRRLPNIIMEAWNLKPEDAIKYLKHKGIVLYDSAEQYSKIDHRQAFTVAKITKASLLKDVKGMLEKSLDEGLSFNDFKKSLQDDPRMRKWRMDAALDTESKYNQRMALIFRNNMQSALQRGRYEAMMSMTDIRPWFQYIAILDNRTTPFCRRMHGTVARFDDPIWKGAHPPVHHACRSRVDNLRDEDVERLGLKIETYDDIAARMTSEGVCSIGANFSEYILGTCHHEHD